MKEVSIRDLADLVESDVPDAASRLQKLFEWRFQQDLEVAKWVLGAAASLAIAALVSYLKGDTAPGLSRSILMVGLPVATSSYGVYCLLRLRSIHKQFIAAVRIHAELQKVKAFIARYRETVI